MTARFVPAIAAGCLLVIVQPLASVQHTRALSGVVFDKRGNPLKGAAVEIENTISLQIASYVTRNDGKYYFHDLSPDVDYTIRAKYKHWWSKEKRLSKFNEKHETIIDLEVRIE